MFRTASSRRTLTGTACAAMLAAGVCTGAAASAASDSCAEWLRDHAEWKARVIERYLHGAPQNEVDGALFEMLQREAYLTSCETSTRNARDALVGWRLVDRSPDEYAGAVVEAVLEHSGFDLSLRGRLTPVLGPAPADDPTGIARPGIDRRASAARYARQDRPGAPR